MNDRIRTMLFAMLLAAGVSAWACQPSNTAKSDNPSANTASANESAQVPSPNVNETSIANKTSSAEDSPGTQPTPAPPPNAVCPDPKNPCRHKDKTFDDWELSFRLPSRIKPNTSYESAPFYAVILKEYKDIDPDSECDGGEYTESIERERKHIQSSYPTRKVFADHNCPNMASVGYDFTGRSDGEKVLVTNFIAIYAGATEDEANTLLGELRPQFPRAVVKRMTVAYEQIEQ